VTNTLNLPEARYRAIRTRFFGPTNTRGSRYVADAGDDMRVSVQADDALNSEQNHATAAMALVRKMGWDAPVYQPITGGQYEGDGSYYWVFMPDPPREVPYDA
jgi:hypothetical protein